MIRFAALGSGSRGNAWLVEAGGTRVLLDCGFALRETSARLGRLGVRAEDLDGILVTHEHGDHVGGVARLAKRYRLPVWLTHGTHAAMRERGFAELDCRVIDSHAELVIGDLLVRPFPVPHDAREPVQFVFSDGARCLGILTDVGSLTPCILDHLSPCDALVLEANHDAELLRASRYPESLKRRIAGRFGHLENTVSAELLQGISVRRDGLGHLQHVVAAHLSEENNRPELARAALAAVLGAAPGEVLLADQALGMDWREIA